MLDILIHKLDSQWDKIENWFSGQWATLRPPPYFSCDIRHSGSKIAVVDTNLFPAGFNNLCNSYSKVAVQGFRTFFQEQHPGTKKILLLVEEHTRNKYYMKNIYRLMNLIQQAGLECRAGYAGVTLQEENLTLSLEPETLQLEKIIRNNDKVLLKDFEPDLVLSNNDLSSGIPETIQNISQPIIPDPQMGWHKRTKFRHFELFWKLAEDFGKTFDIDPWFLVPYTHVVEELDLTSTDHLNRLAQKVDSVLEQIAAKYKQYNISDTPYLFMKNNQGTYGMGIETLYSGQDVLGFNRRQRNKLQSAKGGATVTSYLLQEGIPTIDKYSDQPIEPVMYGIGKNVVGGFFRIHESRNEFESLNAAGMTFSCLCMHKLDEPHEGYFLDCRQKQKVVQMSTCLAQMAALAAAHEMKEIMHPNSD